MSEPTGGRVERWQVALGEGSSVELDGSVLQLDPTAVPVRAVVLRLLPWRAQSLSYALHEWATIVRLIHSGGGRPEQAESELSYMLALAAAAAEDRDKDVRTSEGREVVPGRRRVEAMALLDQLEPSIGLTARLALVEAAAWWLAQDKGSRYAHALLTATCTEPTSAERAYLALIDPQSGTSPTGDGQADQGGRSS